MFCHNCGAELKNNAKFCPRCGQSAYDPVNQTAAAAPAAPRENVPLGTVGALAGGFLGGVVTVLLSRMGIYSAFAGFLMSVGAILGYDWLGKRRGTVGTVIVILVILAVPYLANTLSWSLFVLDSVDALYTPIQGIALFYALLTDGYIDVTMYVQELLVLYGFAALGAVMAFSRTARRREKTAIE